MPRLLPQIILFCGFLNPVLAQKNALFTTDQPGETPQLFAPGFICGPYLERDMAISAK
ncbi:hypothetical protein [Larkinella rosea]|uniref:hypothetical protein n=1 Tax=Larkinella rosea TaxID=2025312 RepID=UPI00163B09D7|nr:hypothetical protein [Larkinella rosea]